jgi:hypothetical protein
MPEPKRKRGKGKAANAAAAIANATQTDGDALEGDLVGALLAVAALLPKGQSVTIQGEG